MESGPSSHGTEEGVGARLTTVVEEGSEAEDAATAGEEPFTSGEGRK